MFRSRRMAVLAALGFSSGLPLLLVGQTLSAAMTQANVKLATIGAFAAVGLPYSFKWVWAPLMDRYRLPWLGRRRGWAALIQLLLALAIAAMGIQIGRLVALGTAAPRLPLALLALLVAFLAASQDIVLDAYNTDLLSPAERAAGTAVYVMGYRVAILVAGTAALILADHLSWTTIYAGLALLMVVGLVAVLCAEEPAPSGAAPPRTLYQAVRLPVLELAKLERVATVLAFVALYKLGDTLLSNATLPFLKRAIGFTNTEIAAFNKVCGFAGTLVGGVAAGALVTRWGVRRALLVFGGLQASTNLAYALLAQVGRSWAALATAVTVDNVANAMGSGAFVAYLMSLCDPRVSATQYALLTSLSTLAARLLGFSIGPLQERLGWTGFFVATALFALPGLLLARRLPQGPPPT